MGDNATRGDASDSNAISLFGQSANMNDFPVLKAFQEYIDAEQAKARKRMLGLSIFFIVLLVAVVITFTIIMTSIFTHNRELSDRLLDIAFRQRQEASVQQQQPAPAPQQIVVPQPVVTTAATPAQDAGMKALLEKLESLATAMATRQQQAVAPTPVVVTTAAPAPVNPAPAAESQETLKMREMLKKQQAELEAERAKVKATEEKLRQAEIERHRRRLYPEYYAQQDVATARQQEPPRQVPAASVKPVAVPAKSATPVQKPAPPAQKSAVAQPVAASEPKRKNVPASLKDMKPIDYFAQSAPKETTPKPPSGQSAPSPAAKKVQPSAQPAKAPPAQAAKAAIPAKPADKPRDAAKTETISVGQGADDSIPWLIEQTNL